MRNRVYFDMGRRLPRAGEREIISIDPGGESVSVLSVIDGCNRRIAALNDQILAAFRLPEMIETPPPLTWGMLLERYESLNLPRRAVMIRTPRSEDSPFRDAMRYSFDSLARLPGPSVADLYPEVPPTPDDIASAAAVRAGHDAEPMYEDDDPIPLEELPRAERFDEFLRRSSALIESKGREGG